MNIPADRQVENTEWKQPVLICTIELSVTLKVGGGPTTDYRLRSE